jgi:hypothetical protein
MDNEFERIWKEAVVAERLRIITKTLRQAELCLGQITSTVQ